MPELKHVFSKGQMNKDLDERLVPNGQYRDALNVEVSTSESANVGVVQTLKGTTTLTTHVDDGSTCVGSITDEQNDTIYWLVAGPSGGFKTTGVLNLNHHTIFRDYILEYSNATKYVVVDIHRVEVTVAAGALNALSIEMFSTTGIRKGMLVTGSGWSNTVTVTSVNHTTKIVTIDNAISVVGPPYPQVVTFRSPTSEPNNSNQPPGRVLNFSSDRLITGLNVIDGMIFWTDDYSEPKKINVERSKLGCDDDDSTTTGTGSSPDFHTRLVDTKAGVITPLLLTDYEIVADTAPNPVFLEEKYVTVIKIPPLTPPVLNMSSSIEGRGNIAGSTQPMQFWNTTPNPDVILVSGDSVSINVNPAVDYQEGDYLILSNVSGVIDFTEFLVRLRVVSYVNNVFSCIVESVSEEVPNANEVWRVLLEQPTAMFEKKFVRFGYRYKFEDGEYSSFSPFSNVAFIPDSFDYEPKKGHNLGMVNDLRTLKIQDFVLEKALRPRDIKEIDILYKEDGSPNVYTVKTINKDSNEWIAAGSGSGITGGEVLIESDTIHATLPSNQILRSFDAVPRKAKAQDMTGNRVIYGNYLKGYDVVNDRDQRIDIILQTSLASDSITTFESPEKSLKSMRNYQVGIVYRDVYGRETPVLITETDNTVKNTVKVPKNQSVSSNRLVTEISNSPPKWADSFKFFVKETSNEYYNLAMDRWYDAEDGNIWLAFPSAERNKVDEETFLILKKRHDSTAPVTNNTVKYKILAIKNEAPDFIKINNQYIDTISNGTVGGLANARFGETNGATGFPLFQTDNVIVDAEAWEESACVDEVTSGDTYLRFRADNEGTSNWYQITAVKSSDAVAGINTKLTIDGNFQTDMSFTSTANSYATRVSGLKLDIKRQTVENRAEFDGRFFVKIHKDQFVREHIIKDLASLSNDVGLQVVQQIPVRYVATSQLNSDNGANSGTPPGSLTYKGSTGDNAGATTAAEWELETVGSWDTIQSPNSQYPNAVDPTIGGFGVPLSDLYTTSGGSEYWKAFSAVGIGAVGTQDNNNFFIDEAYFHETNPDGTANNFDTYAGYGQGIRDNLSVNNGPPDQDLIDISFSEIEPGGLIYSGAFKDTFSSATYPLSAAFIDKLTQVGTQFRIKEDPDQIIYTVQEFVNRTDYIKNYFASHPNAAWNKRVRWTISVSPKFGGGPTGAGTAAGPYHPCRPLSHAEVDASTYANGLGLPALDYNHGNIGSVVNAESGTKKASLMQPHGNSPGHTFQILESVTSVNDPVLPYTENPAVWETEPKEDVGLDIYYEVGTTYPVTLDHRTNEQFIPIGSTFVHSGTTYKVSSWDEETVKFTKDDGTAANVAIPDATELTFTYLSEYDSNTSITDKPGGVTATADGVGTSAATSTLKLKTNIHNTSKFTLPWYNCFTFGNGVESNRIRDDFNAMFMDKGVKVSTTMAQPYAEERRGSSLIFGGIYNSKNGINNTNQFIEAEGITKDLNPKYGTIQKLHTRDGDIVALCEDKIFKIIAYKDALYLADGNPQLTATNKVLGGTTPVRGEYGISKNPESFVFQGYQTYFTDRVRGVVLRMSLDGLTPISNVGMKDYFADILKTTTGNIIGTFDDKKTEYNVTLKGVTLAYNEGTDGWVSFRSYLPESGVSFNNDYYTFKEGELHKHHDNSTRNNFYGTQHSSNITVLINGSPSSVKNFKTLNYEGSQAKITQFRTSTLDSAANDLDGTYGDGEYYNLAAKNGWYVTEINTDMQEGLISEFKDKENKWFNYLRGVETTLSNLDQKEFSVQGIGEASAVSRSDGSGDDGQGRTQFKLHVVENND